MFIQGKHILRRGKQEGEHHVSIYHVVCWLVGCFFWVSRPGDLLVWCDWCGHGHSAYQCQLTVALWSLVLPQSWPELTSTCREQWLEPLNVTRGCVIHRHTKECMTLVSRETVPSLLEKSLFLIAVFDLAVRYYVGSVCYSGGSCLVACLFLCFALAVSAVNGLN